MLPCLPTLILNGYRKLEGKGMSPLSNVLPVTSQEDRASWVTTYISYSPVPAISVQNDLSSITL